MLHRTERTLENIPVGPLGFIPVDGCQELGKKVDDYLVKWRKETAENTEDDTDEDVEALQTRIAELEAEVKELKANAKSKEDARILAAVKAAGGEAWLSKARSNYKVDEAPKAKATGDSFLSQRLSELRKK